MALISEPNTSAPSASAVEERTDPEAIPRQEQRAVPGIPDRHGELAVQALEAVRTKVFIQMQHDLGVRVGGESCGPEPPVPISTRDG